MKYLIVDDHAVIRQTVMDVLCQPGDTFEEACTGEAAVALYDRHHHDWVIMDVRMPGIGGLAAAQEITSRYPDSQVVIMSQFEGSDCADKASECGARAFVSKERIADLHEILAQLDKGNSTQFLSDSEGDVH